MTDDTQRPLKVFLCHAHSDAAEVRALYARLKADGVDAWLDKENIIAGQDWDFEIRKAVRESDIVVVCLSQQFNQKGYRQNEVRAALDEAALQPEGEIFIIPARLEECDYLESLRRFHGVDLFEERGYEFLMRALRLRAQKIGAVVQKNGWLGSFTSPIKKPVAKKPAPKPTPRKRAQFNIDPKIAFRVFLGIAAVLVVAFGVPRLASYFSQIESPTPLPTSILILTPTLPTETNTPVFTATATPLSPEITDAKGIRMNLVPAGTFKMGSTINDDEKPIHDVYLDDYYMDIYEVTNAAYKLCVSEGKCELPSDTDKYNDLAYSQHPVVYVDWNMAKTFCEWRGARLPTEAEWEKAARGIDARTYPWGEDISCDKANYSRCRSNIVPVGMYESGKSPYGMYDMAGNAWEWVSSLYQPYPYDPNDGRDNLNVAGDRVLRGGSWGNNDGNVRSAIRYWLDPPFTYNYIGFRCARSLP